MSYELSSLTETETNLGSLQALLSYEVDHCGLLHTRHEHPAAPGHQGQRPVLRHVGVGSDDVLPDAARHDPPQPVHSVRVGAGVVEHHHGPVLDVMKPPLDGDKPSSTDQVEINYL